MSPNMSDIDSDDREAAFTISGGMLFLLGVLFLFHIAGLRFAGGISGGITL